MNLGVIFAHSLLFLASTAQKIPSRSSGRAGKFSTILGIFQKILKFPRNTFLGPQDPQKPSESKKCKNCMHLAVIFAHFRLFLAFTAQKVLSRSPRRAEKFSTILEIFQKISKISRNTFLEPQDPQKPPESEKCKIFMNLGVIFGHFRLFLAIFGLHSAKSPI